MGGGKGGWHQVWANICTDLLRFFHCHYATFLAFGHHVYIQPQSSFHFRTTTTWGKNTHLLLFSLSDRHFFMFLSLFLSPLLKMQASFSLFLWLFLILSITHQACKQKGMVEYTHKASCGAAWRGGVTAYCRDPASHTHKTHCVLSHLLFRVTKNPLDYELWRNVMF